MLQKLDLKEIQGQYNVDNSSLKSMCDLKKMALFESIEKIDCREILETNNLIQVLTGIVYHNGFEDMPITIDFNEGMDWEDFINVPTVRLLPSIFERVRFFTYDKKFFGVWASTLLEEAKLAFEQLYEEDKIDKSLKSIFRIGNKTFRSSYQKKVIGYEIVAEEHLTKMENIINDKLIVYLLSECNKNNGCFGIPLSGWTLDEIEGCTSFTKLKMVFDRIFIIGCGQEWQSTHLIVKQPKNELIDTIFE